MAKLLDPLHSQSASGTFDGLSYSTHRGINTVRRHTSTNKQPTAKQAKMRALYASASGAWSTSSDAVKKSWREYSKHRYIGPISFLNRPYDHYMAQHSRLGAGGFMPLTFAVIGIMCIPPEAFETAQTGPTVTLTWTSPEQPEDHEYYTRIWRQGPTTSQTKPDISHRVIIAYPPILAQLWIDSPPSPGWYNYWIQTFDVTAGEISSELTHSVYYNP